MTAARYLLGVLLVIVTLGPVTAGSWAIRRRLLPEFRGAPARLVEAVVCVSTVVVVSEVLGALGLYRAAPITGALAVVGILGYLWAAPPTPPPPVEPAASTVQAPTHVGRAAHLVAAGAIALVAADWGGRTAHALRRGMESIDTLWYHMPVAARFVQTGTIRHLHYVDGDAITVFFPANSPLLHGLGILLLGSDVASPVLNLGWLALTLLAAWCVGRPWGVAPVTVTGAALLLATPGLVATQAGGAYNDVVGLALFLAAIAILVTAHTAGAMRPPALAVAGLAAGLAAGTKFTFLGPVAGLTIAVVVLAPKGRRVRDAVLWCVAVGLTGAFWYARNFAAVGNPMPSLSLHLGPLSLTRTPYRTPDASIAEYLFEATTWRRYFLPGFDKTLGPAWWAVGLFLLAGLVAGLVVGGSRLQRAVAFVGIVALATYIVTPQSMTFRAFRAPIYFAYQVRYGAPAYLLGLVLLPTIPAIARRASWLLGGYAGALAATQLDPTIWPTTFRRVRFDEPVHGLEVAAGAAIGVVVLLVCVAALTRRAPTRRAHPSRIIGAGLAAILLVAGGGAILQRTYLDRRYQRSPPLPRVYRWARSVHDSRIAVAGDAMFLQYPLYGKDLSNHVQYIGVRGPRGSVVASPTCAAWRGAVNAGHYRYLIVGARNAETPELRWTATDPAAHRTPVTDAFITFGGAQTVFVYRLDGRLAPTRCPDAALP